ncbi:MAG: tetratricopeptide repeat protein [Candidatus Aenigmatarchaeota archaeon]
MVLIVFVVVFGFILPSIFLEDKNISNFISLVISLFLTPFSVIYGFLIYEDLKRVKKDALFVTPGSGIIIKYILTGIFGILLLFGVLFGETFYEQTFHKDLPVKTLKKRRAEEYMKKAEEEMAKYRKAIKEGIGEKERFDISRYVSNAINYAQIATKLEPYNPEMWFRQGNIYFELKGVSGADSWALHCYKKALELDPNNQLYRQKVEELTR